MVEGINYVTLHKEVMIPKTIEEVNEQGGKITLLIEHTRCFFKVSYEMLFMKLSWSGLKDKVLSLTNNQLQDSKQKLEINVQSQKLIR